MQYRFEATDGRYFFDHNLEAGLLFTKLRFITDLSSLIVYVPWLTLAPKSCELYTDTYGFIPFVHYIYEKPCTDLYF